MDSSTNKSKDLETQHRLLEAAGEVFSELGFRAATVRDICERAKANVAAINYHFGDKETLYKAVLQYAGEQAYSKHPVENEELKKATPEQRLEFFIRSILMRCLGPGQTAWQGKLMIREMAEPTGFLAEFVRKWIRPNFDRLEGIVREIADPKISEEKLRRCCLSIVGQCLYYRFGKPVIEAMFHESKYSESDIERIAEHIAEFSIQAIRPQKAAAKGAHR